MILTDFTTGQPINMDPLAWAIVHGWGPGPGEPQTTDPALAASTLIVCRDGTRLHVAEPFGSVAAAMHAADAEARRLAATFAQEVA